MSEYKNKLGEMAERLKKQEPRPPLQEISPVKVVSAEKNIEAQLNVWIPKDLIKKMKTYGIERELTQKEIAILALESFLEMR